MKIYTKKGDNGKTILANGETIDKNDLRLSTYGIIDELNVLIGILAQKMSGNQSICTQLHWIQNKLFGVGALISKAKGTWVSPDDSERFEMWIDAMQETLPQIHAFIIPSGTQEALISHLCRTHTRTIERLIVELNKTQTENDPPLKDVIKLFNRMSDYFFVLAKFINFRLGIEETEWKKN